LDVADFGGGQKLVTDGNKITVEGKEELIKAINDIIEQLRGSGALGTAVQSVTRGALAYAKEITHVVTSGLQNAHRATIDLSEQPRGLIFIDPSSVNSMGERPSIYGEKEHARGGEHAFYARTVAERGQQLVVQAANEMVRGLPRGN
jgi:hypothetical protein